MVLLSPIPSKLGNGAFALNTRFASMRVITQASSQSLFTSLSREVKRSLYIYVFPDYKERTYLTLAYTAGHVASSELGSKPRRGVVNFKVLFRDPHAGTYIVALKERCEFVELIENYNVSLLMPYLINNGKRALCIYGETGDLEKCVDNLKAYYGARNVYAEKVPLTRCVEEQARNIIHAYVLSHLTEREREFLLKAYSAGYISWRRRARLSELAEDLNVAKPTASLMTRKAIEKVVKRLLLEV